MLQNCRTVHPSFVCVGNNVLYAFHMYATAFVCLYAFGRLIRVNEFNPLAAPFHSSIQNIAFVVWNFYLELSRQCNASQKRMQGKLNGEFSIILPQHAHAYLSYHVLYVPLFSFVYSKIEFLLFGIVGPQEIYVSNICRKSAFSVNCAQLQITCNVCRGSTANVIYLKLANCGWKFADDQLISVYTFLQIQISQIVEIKWVLFSFSFGNSLMNWSFPAFTNQNNQSMVQLFVQMMMIGVTVLAK